MRPGPRRVGARARPRGQDQPLPGPAGVVVDGAELVVQDGLGHHLASHAGQLGRIHQVKPVVGLAATVHLLHDYVIAAP